MLLTRCVLIILALFTLKTLWGFIGDYYTNEPLYFGYHPYEDTQHALGQRLFYTEPDFAVSSDGYTFTLTRAAHWHEKIPIQNSTSVIEQDVLYFEIEVFNPLPWAQPNEAYRHFWATDSLGNRYCSIYHSQGQDMRVYGSHDRTGLFTYTLDMRLENSLSRDAQWIDIHYDCSGRNLIWRIDLTGGGEDA